ncbi:hypothetical protein LR48_Vigan10g224700 [Vigna angularis]|uniref:Uncharacterized protein n=1 Tax=Phaseolus angularis TaxID=3914 RepID=A0A0L9VMS4_PHAAN|nr:hypothetical protein LR48_Vigan10g224700 [Vigna angularis]
MPSTSAPIDIPPLESDQNLCARHMALFVFRTEAIDLTPTDIPHLEPNKISMQGLWPRLFNIYCNREKRKRKLFSPNRPKGRHGRRFSMFVIRFRWYQDSASSSWMRSRYMFGVSNNLGYNDVYGFIDHQVTHDANKFDDIQTYLTNIFASGKEIYFIPYIFG